VRQALENLAACLRAAGASLEDVLKVNVYLADLATSPAQRRLLRVLPQPYPARTTVGVSLPAGLLVEIEAVARTPFVTELELETPAPVVDLDRLERNLARWQQRCDELGLAAGPHIKTHKCVEIARRQLELGATGLTCQTIGEAETMAAAGFDDLLLTTNVLGDLKLARLARLLERAAVTVVVDDLQVLPGLTQAAARSGRPLRVLVECDTGHGRMGVGTPGAAADLAVAVARSDSLEFGGFFTYPFPAGALEFLQAAVDETARRGSRPGRCRSAGRPRCGRSTGGRR
jgi:D-serine deaminase-like pyridoxal phosphate-dependent protein